MERNLSSLDGVGHTDGGIDILGVDSGGQTCRW